VLDVAMRDEVMRDVLVEGLSDWHGLWWIWGQFDRIANRAIRRRATLAFIGYLLERGFLEAGCPRRDGGFDRWALSPADTLTRIETEWDALGRDPNIGDIVWFELTDIGTNEAEKLASSG